MITVYFNYENSLVLSTREERDRMMGYGLTFSKIQHDTLEACLKEISALCRRFEEGLQEEKEKEEERKARFSYLLGRKLALQDLKRNRFQPFGLDCDRHKKENPSFYGGDFIDGYYDEIEQWNPED